MASPVGDGTPGLAVKQAFHQDFRLTLNSKPVMNIVQFFKQNDLDKSVDIRESKNVYEDSETPIMYIRLDKTLDTGQEHLVCSRSLAEDIAAGKLTIKDAEVSLSYGTYGLIRPDTSKVIATVELW